MNITSSLATDARASVEAQWGEALAVYEASKRANDASCAAIQAACKRGGGLAPNVDRALALENKATFDAEVAAVRLLITTRAPDATAIALKLSLIGKVSEHVLDFADEPETVGLILDRPDDFDCSAALLNVYLDALRLSGGDDMVSSVVANGRASFAAQEALSIAA